MILSHASSSGLSEENIQDLKSALAEIKDVAENINTTVNLWDAKSKVVAIQARLGNSAQIVVPGRYLIKEGPLKKGFEKGFHMKGHETYQFFLFNDCVIYAMKRQFGGSELSFTHSLPLVEMEVRDLPDSKDQRNAFSMLVKVSKDGRPEPRTVIVWAETPMEKTEWVNAISTALANLKNQNIVGRSEMVTKN